MKIYVIGIDPGARGALALYCPTNAAVLAIEDMPHVTVSLTSGKKSNRVDFDTLRSILEKWKILAVRDDAHIYCHIEHVQAFGKQSAPAAFNFGYAAAIPYAICRMLDLETRLVYPSVWKNQFGLKASEKDEARKLVLQLFPYLGNLLKRKMDVDRADAVLIAAYKPRIK